MPWGSLCRHIPSFRYTGKTVVSQFEILSTTDNTALICNTNMNRSRVAKCSFTVHLKRNFSNAVKMVLFPSCMLWILAYLTLFLDVGDFNNRNRISVTILLALVTLFGATSMNANFPKTSAFKVIDAWFIWFLLNIFLIITHHILIARLNDAKEKKDNQLHPQTCTPNKGVRSQAAENRNETIKFINRMAIAFFPIAMAIFSTVYFHISLQQI